MSCRIQIVDYDPQWPKSFAREADRISAALGSLALRIEHTGSTSVPGLVAKPVVDMLLVVPSSSDEAAYSPALHAAGYVLVIREPDWFEHRMFNRQDSAVNLHVFTSGCAEIDRILLFRNWFRSDVADCDLYARTKRELAQAEWPSVQCYADAKSEVIGQIIARAQALPL